MLTIGRDDLECDTFKVKGSYGRTIARLFALPVAIESTEPLTLEVTLKGNFRPPKIKRRVYWKRKFIGDFIISSVSQEWDGNKYRTRLELKQCDRTDSPDEDIPVFKWRHDLIALSQNLAETDGALIAAGRAIDPFANSWKLTTDQVASAETDNNNPAVLPVSLGGTGSSDPRIALLNLGGVDSTVIGLPFGVAPLGSDGKVPIAFLPPLASGGGSSVTFPITIAQGGTNALDAATARANLGAIALADIPPFPALGELGGVSSTTFDSAIAAFNSAIALKADTSTVSTALALKLDTATFNTAIALKADASALTAGLALKADASALTAGLALKVNNSAINAASGVAGLDVNSLLAIKQFPLNSFFAFTAGASFRAGGIPKVTTTLTQQGVDDSGNPRIWLVNADAIAGNRLKSITVATNGNVQIRHHADNGTDGNVLEHTASGNILTNGTVRPGSNSTAFTGASFVYGSIYYRTDLPVKQVNSLGVIYSTPGNLTYSDGERWRRMDGTDSIGLNKEIITTPVPSTLAANTYMNCGNFVGVGSSFLDSVFLLSVMIMFTDANNASVGHWQLHGATILTSVQWKAGGAQISSNFRLEGHNEADCICFAKFATGYNDRVLQLAFDKVLNFSVGSNGYIRCTLKRLL